MASQSIDELYFCNSDLSHSFLILDPDLTSADANDTFADLADLFFTGIVDE